MPWSLHQVSKKDMSGWADLKGIGLGLVGGLAGTILMDTVMVTTFLMVGEPWDTFFTMVGEKFGDGAVIGIALHNVVGLTGGFVFALLVLSIRGLRIDTRSKGLALGIAAGAITIPVGCIPLAVWLGEPILIVIAFSALPHMVWGTVLGLTMGYGLPSLKIRPSPA
jgi:hypothetical protein